MDVNEENRNAYKQYLVNLPKNQQRDTLKMNIDFIRNSIASSESFVQSLSERNNSVIFLILGIVFGVILNFNLSDNYITITISMSFSSIYLYLIFSYIVYRMYIKNHTVIINIGKNYLYKMSNRLLREEYVSGSLLIYDCKSEISKMSYSKRWISIHTVVRNYFLYFGIACFVLQFSVAFINGIEDWPILSPREFYFSDFLKAALEFLKN